MSEQEIRVMALEMATKVWDTSYHESLLQLTRDIAEYIRGKPEGA